MSGPKYLDECLIHPQRVYAHTSMRLLIADLHPYTKHNHTNRELRRYSHPPPVPSCSSPGSSIPDTTSKVLHASKARAREETHTHSAKCQNSDKLPDVHLGRLLFISRSLNRSESPRNYCFVFKMQKDSFLLFWNSTIISLCNH